MKNELKKDECPLGLDVTSRLIGTGHFQPPVLGPSKGQWECTRVPITLTPTYTQPPGSRPQTLRVSTHGQRAAPFRRNLTSLHGDAVGIFYALTDRAGSHIDLIIFQNKQ